ncbi:DEAD/DEAH box helicase [Carpediemonas membranifera]|uniref:DEAD/DEAH box helicase n=1 Tax=Carpediemonas membranifera TaxID=201153 RepID=A0A8J6B300_9EUKA|nr:DEAD/DEAH box helicase [Carpediemonas membranifera]|eukprot:KAG9391877.1 DEAD/DEAH box helicase [Carpediemonas membranifera]
MREYEDHRPRDQGYRGNDYRRNNNYRDNRGGRGGNDRRSYGRDRGNFRGNNHRDHYEERIEAPQVVCEAKFAESGNEFAKLAPEIQQAIFEAGYETPTPIQAQSIPPLLERKDFFGSAQTGTGKTAAFTLPILHHLVSNRRPVERYRPRVLILAPTRELCTQIGDQIEKYGKYCGIWHVCVYGGVSKGPQTSAFRQGVDVCVATPGRLIDLLDEERFTLDNVDAFVLDEADRMLDMGFIPDIERITKLLPQERWNLFFSATLSGNILNLANRFVTDPVRVTIEPEKPTVDRINQKLMYVEKNRRNDLLLHVLKESTEDKVIVFCKTKAGAERVSELVDRDFPAVSIHGDKSQAQRDQAIRMFKANRVRVLVATDVAARGLDINNVGLVINYDLPQAGDAESYVHRIGRTARAGKEGDAFSFVSADDGDSLRQVEKYIRKKIDANVDHPFHSDFAEKEANRPSYGRGGGRGGYGNRYGGNRGYGGNNRGYGGRPQLRKYRESYAGSR